MAIDRARRVARLQGREMAVLEDLKPEDTDHPFEYCPVYAVRAIFPDSTVVLIIEADGSESEPEPVQGELIEDNE